jgi:poly-gamma-glutamate synthesis protein (capsule biosynthesis protein)
VRRLLFAAILAASSVAGVPHAQRAAANAPAATETNASPAIATRGDDARPFRIVAVGDLALSWRVGHGIAHEHFDPFASVHETIAGAHLAFANLETVLSNRLVPAQAPHAFPPLIVGPPEAAQTLAAAGFDVVSVANNHAFDLHAEGLEDTLAALREARVTAVGGGVSWESAREPVVMNVDGVRVGVLAFAYGTNEHAHGAARVALLDEHAPEAVRSLRARVDLLLVSLHWGVEMTHTPRPEQIAIAHALVDAGADAILGHHPHVLQSVEVYAGHPIAYSLGNFVFGPQPEARRTSAMLELQWSRTARRFDRATLVPVRLDGPRGAPRIVSGAEADAVRRLVREASAMFETRLVARDDVLDVDSRSAHP